MACISLESEIKQLNQIEQEKLNQKHIVAQKIQALESEL